MGKILNDLKVIQEILKQYIQINDENKTDFLSVTCGVLQCSILGPFLFLFYVNDFSNASKFPDLTILQMILICSSETATLQYCLLQ